MKKLFIIPAFLLFVTSCNFGDQMKEILWLSKEINDKYNGNAGITINNGHEIEVKLDNSPYCDSSDEVKQRVSDEIGAMVMAHKALSKKLEEGNTIFNCHTSIVVVSVSEKTSFPMHLRKN